MVDCRWRGIKRKREPVPGPGGGVPEGWRESPDANGFWTAAGILRGGLEAGFMVFQNKTLEISSRERQAFRS
jgi:hypothetical protein